MTYALPTKPNTDGEKNREQLLGLSEKDRARRETSSQGGEEGKKRKHFTFTRLGN